MPWTENRRVLLSEFFFKCAESSRLKVVRNFESSSYGASSVIVIIVISFVFSCKFLLFLSSWLLDSTWITYAVHLCDVILPFDTFLRNWLAKRINRGEVSKFLCLIHQWMSSLLYVVEIISTMSSSKQRVDIFAKTATRGILASVSSDHFLQMCL